MARQYFPDLTGEVQLARPTALTATTIEALWPAALYTPIPAFDMQSVGRIYELRAGGIWSTSTSGTLIITPTLTNGSIALGVSQTQTIPFSMTNVPWRIQAELVCRAPETTAGGTGTVILVGHFTSGGLTTNASPGGSVNLGFGGTAASPVIDVATNLQIQKTLSVAGSMSTDYAYLKRIN